MTGRIWSGTLCPPPAGIAPDELPTENLTEKSLTMNHNEKYPAVWEFVSPETAAAWLGMNIKNRRQKKVHIDGLVRDLKAGRWVDTADPIRFDVTGHMIDGQHRLTAIIRAGVGVWMLVVRGLPGAAQAIIDSNSVRSGSDSLQMRGFVKYSGIIAPMAAIAAGISRGVLSKSTDTGAAALTRQETYEWADTSLQVIDSAQAGGRLYGSVQSTPAILGYAHLTLHNLDPEGCEEFFGAIENMQTDGLGDPRFALAKVLSREHELKVVKRPARQLYYIFTAWNAWQKGAEIRLLRATTNGTARDIPEPIVNPNRTSL